MASYPQNSVAFTQKTDLLDIVRADDINQVYNEVTAIAGDLGSGTGTGLRYSGTWGATSTLDSSTTAWTGLQARLQNIENGVYSAYTYRVDSRGGSVLQSSTTTTIGLVFRLRSSQTADVVRVRNSGDTSTILSINTSGTITTTGDIVANKISGGTP
jgi:hypothetical protein